MNDFDQTAEWRAKADLVTPEETDEAAPVAAAATELNAPETSLVIVDAPSSALASSPSVWEAPAPPDE